MPRRNYLPSSIHYEWWRTFMKVVSPPSSSSLIKQKQERTKTSSKNFPSKWKKKFNRQPDRPENDDDDENELLPFSEFFTFLMTSKKAHSKREETAEARERSFRWGEGWRNEINKIRGSFRYQTTKRVRAWREILIMFNCRNFSPLFFRKILFFRIFNTKASAQSFATLNYPEAAERELLLSRLSRAHRVK